MGSPPPGPSNLVFSTCEAFRGVKTNTEHGWPTPLCLAPLGAEGGEVSPWGLWLVPDLPFFSLFKGPAILYDRKKRISLGIRHAASSSDSPLSHQGLGQYPQVLLAFYKRREYYLTLIIEI